jgi:phage-related protein
MNLLVELGVDSTDFYNEMDRAEGKAHKSGKNILAGIGGAMAGIGTVAVAAMAAVGAALVSTIQPASDLNETISKTQIVFGDSGAEMVEWGKGSATALGMSQNAALGAAATYGNLFRSMGIGVDTSADMSKNLVGLAGDLASFNNMDPTVVLDSLRAGLTGETEPLKKLGININAVTLQEKAMEMGLWDGVGTLDAAAKAQASYAIMLGQTSLAQGDFARTSDGLANQQRIMTANFENIKATIGTGLLPIIAPLVGGLNDTLGGILGIIQGSGTMDKKMSGIGDLLSGFVSGLVSGLPSILEMGSKLVISIVAGIVKTLPSMIPAAVSLLMTLVNGIITLIPKLLDAGLKIIIGLVVGIAAALPNLIPAIVSMMINIVTVLIENIPLLLNAAVQIIMGLINGIIAALPMIIEQLPVIIMAIVQALITALPLLMQAAVQIIVALINGIVSNLPQLIVMAINLIVSLVAALIGALPMLLKAGVQMLTGIVTGIKNALPLLKTAAMDAMNGFWEGLKSKFDFIKTGISNFIAELVRLLKGILGIASPSKVFFDIGKNMMVGVKNGIEKFAVDPIGIPASISTKAKYLPSSNNGVSKSVSQEIDWRRVGRIFAEELARTSR